MTYPSNMPLNVQKVKWGHVIGAGEAADGARADADRIFSAWVSGPVARVPAMPTRAGLQAVLFDLDGVLVDTAAFHFQAWARLADELGIVFDEQTNQGFRGVGRMECLEKLLGEHGRFFVMEEKLMLAERKNEYYLEQVNRLGPKDLAAGARGLAMGLRALDGGGVRLGLVSASRNARRVLELLEITDWFEAIVDGGQVTKSKPDPQGFLLAAERLRVRPERCVVIEDAEAGLRAAHVAGMAAVAVGSACGGGHAAGARVEAIGEVTLEVLEQVWEGSVGAIGG